LNVPISRNRNARSGRARAELRRQQPVKYRQLLRDRAVGPHQGGEFLVPETAKGVGEDHAGGPVGPVQRRAQGRGRADRLPDEHRPRRPAVGCDRVKDGDDVAGEVPRVVVGFPARVPEAPQVDRDDRVLGGQGGDLLPPGGMVAA
jgi:hypothetical protein